jgi:FkbM family methyltransferase
MSIKDSVLSRYDIVADRVKFVVDLIDLESINTILDVGSWHLKQSIEFAELFPEAKIYAFEPNPNNYQECISTYNSASESVKSRIEIFNTAVDSIDGTIKFYPVINENPGASSKYKFIKGLNGTFLGKDWIQEEIEVDATTLDTWATENSISSVDCIWIDVQGAELDVFKGARDVLTNVKVIFTEVATKSYYDGQPLYSELNEFLVNEGFCEVEISREDNVIGYEINTIYVRK